MALGKRGGVIAPLAVGLELLKPSGLTLPWVAERSLGPVWVVAGDRQGLRGPMLAPKQVLQCWAWLRGVSAPRRGQDTSGRGREGWKPVEAQPKCQEKFIAKAGSCRCAGAPLPLAAPPHAYSCIFMSVRLQMAQL